MRFASVRGRLASFWLVLALIALPGFSQRGQARHRPVEPGEFFPPSAYGNLNPQDGGPASIDLADSIGKKPTVLFYWVAGHPRADAIFQQLQALVGELGPERLAVYGVAVQRPGRGAEQIAERLAELEIRLPVLDDADFVLGQQLRVQTVPNISIFDAGGRLRLSNGASLQQTIGYELTVESAIRRAAASGKLGTYGYLDRYYPVKELVGKPCPDFRAPLLTSSVEQRWSSMLETDKLNVLIFWSVDCPHCRKSLPQINAWLKHNAEGFNIVTAARIVDEVSKTRTKEFCDLNGFVFPTLADEGHQIGDLYQVTSTPTILIIRPDGVIDSVMVSGIQDIGEKLLQKKRELL